VKIDIFIRVFLRVFLEENGKRGDCAFLRGVILEREGGKASRKGGDEQEEA